MPVNTIAPESYIVSSPVTRNFEGHEMEGPFVNTIGNPMSQDDLPITDTQELKPAKVDQRSTFIHMIKYQAELAKMELVRIAAEQRAILADPTIDGNERERRINELIPRRNHYKAVATAEEPYLTALGLPPELIDRPELMKIDVQYLRYKRLKIEGVDYEIIYPERFMYASIDDEIIEQLRFASETYNTYFKDRIPNDPLIKVIILNPKVCRRAFAIENTIYLPEGHMERKMLTAHEAKHALAYLAFGAMPLAEHFVEGITTITDLDRFPNWKRSDLSNYPGSAEVRFLLPKLLSGAVQIPYSHTGLIKLARSNGFPESGFEDREYLYRFGQRFALAVIEYLQTFRGMSKQEAIQKYFDMYAIACRRNLYSSQQADPLNPNRGKQLVKDGQLIEGVSQDDITKQALLHAGIDPNDPNFQIIFINYLADLSQPRLRPH